MECAKLIDEGVNAKLNEKINLLNKGNDWKNYIGLLSLKEMLYAYRLFTYFKARGFHHTILDNFDDFMNSELVGVAIREAKMENAGYVVILQGEMSEYLFGFMTGFLIHSSAFKDNMQLSLSGFCTYPERSFLNAWSIHERGNQIHNLLSVPDMWQPFISIDF